MHGRTVRARRPLEKEARKPQARRVSVVDDGALGGDAAGSRNGPAPGGGNVVTELDPTANRMHIEAAEKSASALQDIVADVADDAEGEPVPEVAEELKDKWSERYGETAAGLPSDTADEIAEHLTAGNDVTVTPRPVPTADDEEPGPDNESTR